MASRILHIINRQFLALPPTKTHKMLVQSLRNQSWLRPPIKHPTNYKVVVPGNVSEQVPPTKFLHPVPLPPYALSGIPPTINEEGQPDIKSKDEIERMRNACRLARKILIEAGDTLRVGMTTDEIDQLIFDLSLAHNAYPSPLNYRGFPKSVCTSVNNVVCHGIPDDRPLADGDILNIDVTVYLDGVHGDCSKTFLVGDVDDAGKRLVAITEECLQIGIQLCKPGSAFSDIGDAVYTHASKAGFNVVGAFTGHGIGTYFHGPPDIYHIPNNYPGKMMPGMTFTVEPAISEGSDRIIILEDGWTAVTTDNSRCAQCEHTVLITEDGVEILTK